MARSELAGLAEEQRDINCWEMAVQGNRELSALIARETGIAHESPQVMLFREGRVIWVASHGGITGRSLLAALRSR